MTFAEVDENCEVNEAKEQEIRNAIVAGFQNVSDSKRSGYVRGNYRCGRCGNIKKGGHICPLYKDKVSKKEQCNFCKRFFTVNANGLIRQHGCKVIDVPKQLNQLNQVNDSKSLLEELFKEQLITQSTYDKYINLF